MEMCFSHIYFKLISILIFPVISLTSDLFREDTFTWVETSSLELSVFVAKEISFTRMTTVWCINECKKFPGCRGIEFCNSGNSLCRLWNGPFDQQMTANETHLECNRFTKDTILTSGMMTESVTITSTYTMPTIGTTTWVNVTTPGTTSPLIDTATRQLTTKDSTIQTDLTTADTIKSVYSTQVDTVSVDSTTTLVDSTISDAKSIGSTTVDTNKTWTTDTITSIHSKNATSSVDSTTVDATTNSTAADTNTTAAMETTSESYCPDCECWKKKGLSGALPIYLNGRYKEVSCGNSSTHSWTVFQRRFDGSESFDRTWLEYEEGFGSAAGEFWLGNRYINSMTMLGYTYLRIEIMTFGNGVLFIEYPNFEIGDSTENYLLRSIGTPTTKSAAMDDTLADSVLRAFSTPDKDNDNKNNGNCALTLKSGWWFNICDEVNLNGEYSLIKDSYGWGSSVKEITMKIRKP